MLLVNPHRSKYPKLPSFPSSKLGMTPFSFHSQVPVGLPLSFMGYGAVVPGGYGVSYNPTPDEIIFCICRWISYRHEFLSLSCFAKLLYSFSSVSTRVLKQAAEGSPPHFNSLFRFDFLQVYTIFNASSRNIIGEHSVSFPRTCSNSSPNDSTSILLHYSLSSS